MEKLTNKEEEIMQVIWELKKAFVNDILDEMPEPKPHYNTLSTIVRLLEEKGFLAHKSYGKSHQYYPIISLEAYRGVFVKDSIKKYFGNSVSNLVNYFVKEEKLSQTDIVELMKIIENNQEQWPMHPFIEYVLKAIVLLIFVGLFYLIVLKKETFYQLNRWYFIGSILISITAPLITFTKTVLVDPIPVAYFVTDNDSVINEGLEEPSFLETIDWQQIAVYLIIFISSVLLIRKTHAVVKLYRSIKKLPNFGASNIKISAGIKTVYSFYRWIVVPENFFKWQNHQMVLDHERIHLNQKHTFDLILIEIVAAVFWFNPLVKVMQRFINSNLEFIVDQKMIETTESVLYQKNLLQFQTQQVIQFANSYNASEIKNRIIQINAKKSTHMKILKFLLATPALVAFFALFQIETVAQVKETIEVLEVFENDKLEDSFYVMIHSQYDDAH